MRKKKKRKNGKRREKKKKKKGKLTVLVLLCLGVLVQFGPAIVPVHTRCWHLAREGRGALLVIILEVTQGGFVGNYSDTSKLCEPNM